MNLRIWFLALLAGSFVVTGCGGKGAAHRQAAAAEKYYGQENFLSAEIGYKNVLQTDPRSPLALRRMGTIWLKRGGLLRAAGFLADAEKISPDDLGVKADLAETMLGLGYAPDAHRKASEILKRDPLNQRGLAIFVESSITPEMIKEADEYLWTLKGGQTVASYHLAKAKLAVQTGNSIEGDAEVSRALEIDPTMAAAWGLKAAIHVVKDDREQAEAAFQSAIQNGSKYSTDRIKYALFLMRTGRSDQAATYLEGVTKEVPDYLTAWRLRAQIAASAENFDEAKRLLGVVLKISPFDMEANLMQSEILLSQGDAEKALVILKSIKQSSPPNPSIEFLLARGYLLTNNSSQARESLNRCIELYPIYQDAIVARAKLDLAEGKTLDAIAGLEALIARSPGAAAQLLLAEAYQQAGRLEDAAGVLKAQAANSSQDFRAHLNLGLALRSQGKMDEARASFEKAALLSPGDFMVSLQLVKLDVAEKKFDAAHAIAESQLRKEPKSAFANYLNGITYKEEKKWPEAEQSLSAAIKLSATLYPAYDALIEVYTESGRSEDAVRQLEALLISNPENLQAMMQLGDLYQKLGRPQDAMKTYDQLLKVNPNFAPALSKAGLLAVKTSGDLAKAYSNVQRARTLAPTEPAIADTLGWIFYKRGEYRRALELIEEAAGKILDDPAVFYHLGEAYYVMGRPVDSQSAFRKVLALGTDFPEKPEAVRKLAMIDALDNSQTVVLLQALVAKEPGDVPALLQLGNEYQINGQFTEAAGIFQDALKVNPELGPALLQLATIYAGPLNQPEQAAQFGREAKEADPNNPAISAATGTVALKTGNYDLAYTLLTEASKNGLAKPAVFMDLASAAYGLGRVAEARDILAKIDNYQPTPEEAAVAAEFLHLTGIEPKDAPQARAEVDSLLAKDPGYLPALVLEGAIQEQSGDLAKAEQIFQGILVKFPQFAPAQKALARIYSTMPAKLAQAESLAMAARQKMKDDVEITATLARISDAKKDNRYTLDLLKEIAAKRELTGEELLWQGKALAATGSKEDAAEALKSASGKGLNPAQSAEAKALLEQLAKEK